MKYDLHTHSKYSHDGTLEPKEIVKIAKKQGLDGIAITDHDTIKGGLAAKKFETDDFKVIVGAEIKTGKGEIIGLFLTEEIKAKSDINVSKAIRKQGGLVICPHPFDRLRKTAFRPKVGDAYLFDAIEVFNSRCVFKYDNFKALNYAHFNKKGSVAGSDAHYANEIGNAITISFGNIKEDIINNTLIEGKKSSSMNHVKTKMLKYWIKT
jgi:predicted metal-dependent phosphoesterase TrpH